MRKNFLPALLLASLATTGVLVLAAKNPNSKPSSVNSASTPLSITPPIDNKLRTRSLITSEVLLRNKNVKSSPSATGKTSQPEIQLPSVEPKTNAPLTSSTPPEVDGKPTTSSPSNPPSNNNDKPNSSDKKIQILKAEHKMTPIIPSPVSDDKQKTRSPSSPKKEEKSESIVKPVGTSETKIQILKAEPKATGSSSKSKSTESSNVSSGLKLSPSVRNNPRLVAGFNYIQTKNEKSSSTGNTSQPEIQLIDAKPKTTTILSVTDGKPNTSSHSNPVVSPSVLSKKEEKPVNTSEAKIQILKPEPKTTPPLSDGKPKPSPSSNPEKKVRSNSSTVNSAPADSSESKIRIIKADSNVSSTAQPNESSKASTGLKPSSSVQSDSKVMFISSYRPTPRNYVQVAKKAISNSEPPKPNSNGHVNTVPSLNSKTITEKPWNAVSTSQTNSGKTSTISSTVQEKKPIEAGSTPKSSQNVQPSKDSKTTTNSNHPLGIKEINYAQAPRSIPNIPASSSLNHPSTSQPKKLKNVGHTSNSLSGARPSEKIRAVNGSSHSLTSNSSYSSDMRTIPDTAFTSYQSFHAVRRPDNIHNYPPFVLPNSRSNLAQSTFSNRQQKFVKQAYAPRQNQQKQVDLKPTANVFTPTVIPTPIIPQFTLVNLKTALPSVLYNSISSLPQSAAIQTGLVEFFQLLISDHSVNFQSILIDIPYKVNLISNFGNEQGSYYNDELLSSLDAFLRCYTAVFLVCDVGQRKSLLENGFVKSIKDLVFVIHNEKKPLEDLIKVVKNRRNQTVSLDNLYYLGVSFIKYFKRLADSKSMKELFQDENINVYVENFGKCLQKMKAEDLVKTVDKDVKSSVDKNLKNAVVCGDVLSVGFQNLRGIIPKYAYAAETSVSKTRFPTMLIAPFRIYITSLFQKYYRQKFSIERKFSGDTVVAEAAKSDINLFWAFVEPAFFRFDNAASNLWRLLGSSSKASKEMRAMAENYLSYYLSTHIIGTIELALNHFDSLDKNVDFLAESRKLLGAYFNLEMLRLKTSYKIELPSLNQPTTYEKLSSSSISEIINSIETDMSSTYYGLPPSITHELSIIADVMLNMTSIIWFPSSVDKVSYYNKFLLLRTELKRLSNASNKISSLKEDLSQLATLPSNRNYCGNDKLFTPVNYSESSYDQFTYGYIPGNYDDPNNYYPEYYYGAYDSQAYCECCIPAAVYSGSFSENYHNCYYYENDYNGDAFYDDNNDSENNYDNSDFPNGNIEEPFNSDSSNFSTPLIQNPTLEKDKNES